MKSISVEDIQNYCENCLDELLVHGTNSSCVEDIVREGLLVRSTGHPTVLSSNEGFLHDGTPITKYVWYEPRSEGESVAVILQIPRSIILKIQSKGIPITQKNVFEEICEDIELEVPDTEKTRNAYLNSQKSGSETKLSNFKVGLVGPKFSKLGEKPGTKYKHIGIPSKYICAITSHEHVYYVSGQVQDAICKHKEVFDVGEK